MFERVYNKTHFRKVLNQALEEERLGFEDGGYVEPRQVFYKGSSVEKFLPKIKKLYKEGKGTKAIAKEVLGSETKKTTIASAIDAMKSGEAPVKLTKQDIAANAKNKFTSGVVSEGADEAGLRKYLQKLKPEFRPNQQALANKFGFKDKGVVKRIAKEVGKESLFELPTKPSKESVRRETVKSKNVNFLNDKDFKKELKNFKPSVTGSDSEIAKYLNDKGFKAYGGKSFTADNVGSRRLRLKIPSKNITTRGKVFTDKQLLKEAQEMNLNIKNKTPEEIRRAVFQSRDLEKGRSPEEIKKLRNFRRRKANMAGKKRQFPVSIGKKATPKDLFWKDLVENAFRHQASIQDRPGPILSKSHIQFLNPKQTRPTDIKSVSKIQLVDTNVVDKSGKPKILTYENFAKHIDKNKNLYGIDYDTAIREYEKKRFIQQNPDLRNQLNMKLNKRYDPTSATSRAVFSPFHIHHTAGRGQNAFNVQFATASDNMKENALRRQFDKNFKNAKTLSEKKAAAKLYLEGVPDTLEVRFKKTPYGTRPVLIDQLKAMGAKLTPEIRQAAVTLGANPFFNNPITRKIAAGATGVGLPLYMTYDIASRLEQGKGPIQALEEGIIGTEIAKAINEYRALSPEGKAARSIVKQTQATEDPLYGSFFTGASQQELEKAQEIYKMEQAKAQQQIQQEQQQRAQRIKEQGLGAFEGNYGP